MYAVTGKVKGQGNKVTSSVWCRFAHNSTMRSHVITKIGRMLSVPLLTFCTSSKTKRSKSWSAGHLTPWPEWDVLQTSNKALSIQHTGVELYYGRRWTLYTDGVRCHASHTHIQEREDLHNWHDLQAESSGCCSSHHLQGDGGGRGSA